MSRAGWSGGEVERLEVVLVGLDLGPVEHHVAHRGEQVLELARELRDRVQGPALGRRRRQRGIESPPRAALFERRVGQARARLVEQGLDLVLELVGAAAGQGPFRTRQRRDARQQLGHDAALVQVFALDRAQILLAECARAALPCGAQVARERVISRGFAPERALPDCGPPSNNSARSQRRLGCVRPRPGLSPPRPGSAIRPRRALSRPKLTHSPTSLTLEGSRHRARPSPLPPGRRMRPVGGWRARTTACG